MGHIQRFIAVFRKTTIYTHLEGSAILIAHSGKGNVAAVRQGGLAYEIAAGDRKTGRDDFACIHSFGKQAAADGKRGGTSFGDNLALKQAVADGDGSAIIHERHTLFKGPAGDGAAVVIHRLLEGAAGDVFGVVHRSLEGAAGDGAIIVGFTADGAAD